jgi:hypothetical protein
MKYFWLWMICIELVILTRIIFPSKKNKNG